MRARLSSMTAGQEFRFLCTDKMAEKMDRIVALAGGEVVNRDDRSYGVVISVRKKGQIKPLHLSGRISTSPGLVVNGDNHSSPFGAVHKDK